MITRRGFITSCVAAIPVLGIMVASQRDSTNAQTRPDATPETLRPRWKTALDTTITPDRPRYVTYTYVATRQTEIPEYATLSHRRLTQLGFTPSRPRDRLPDETYVPQSNAKRIGYNRGAILIVIAKVDE